MALTPDETRGSIVPGFVTDLEGRISVVTAGDDTEFGSVVAGFLTDIDGRLVVSEITTDAAWDGGFVRLPAGELVVTTDATDAAWVNGHWRSPAGYLVVANDAADPEWVGGFVRNTNALGVTGLVVLPTYGEYVVDNLNATMLLPLTATDGLVDATGNGHDGTAVGPTVGAFSPGPLARADDGATEWAGTAGHHISTAYSPFVAAANWTVMGWLYRDDSATNHSWFGGDGAASSPWFRLFSGNDNVSWYVVGNAAGNTIWAAALTPAAWHHVALTFDDTANTAAFYVDGALISSQTNSVAYSTPGNLRIGAYANTSAWTLNGKQAWFSVHEEVLTDEDIAAAYVVGST